MGIAPIKTGYKQTDLGVIPQDWDVKKLGDICVAYSGGTPSTSNPSYYGGNIPWITSSDLNMGIINAVNGRITKKGLENSSAKIVKSNTFLLALYGATAGVAGFTRIEGAINQAILALIPKNEDPIYLYQYFIYKKNWLIQTYTQGGQPNLSGEIIKSILLPLPLTKAQQSAIAAVLSDTDALIEHLEKLIAKKKAIKQGTMQQLLTGKKRLPGFDEIKGFKRTELGDIPDDWSITPLASLVDPSRSIRYGIVQPGKFDPNGRYMIRGQDYSEVKGWAKPYELFRVSPIIEDRYRNARVKAGDLIMTIVGYCGYVEVIPEWLEGANLTQTTARIAIDPDKASSSYCKYALLSDIGKCQVSLYLKGAAQPGLNIRDVEIFKLLLPSSILEQIAIATILSNMDVEIESLEKKRDKYDMLKQGMMQVLLTGKIRLI